MENNKKEMEKEIERLKEKEKYGVNGMVRFIAMSKRMNLQKKLQEKEDYEWELNEIRNGR
ncbi:hypothetical protein KQ3_05869 [Bacillus cereus B5-2]|nr:hypothetical protein KQ3_05869 [Bacillus cereus B5-2]